jgi:DNA primase
MSAIDEIKSRIDIVDIVSQSVKLRRTGKNYSGFCPFHPNTRTPAFAIFPESGTWRCFGQCNEGGDIFKFVMKKEGWDFATALRYLAEKAGVRLEPLTPERQEQEEEHARLRSLLEEAVTFYRHQLTQTPAGKPAFEYLQSRGLTPATIETFGLGYAPPGWETALAYFTSKEYTPDELLQAGLVTERGEGGGYRDRFHNRILFPIRDAMGKMCGFGGRILDPNDIPKFINSPQTVLFDKGRLLYGLDQARKTIRAQEQAVIVEGYLDVIALHQAGFTNTVSPMGTALTEDQLRLLKRFTRRMVLALDADAAGEKATLRGLELARQALDHSDEIVFDPRGLLRHEARLQADVRVTTLPAGKDPDEVALADAGQWAQIVADARPIVVHVMETLAASRNLEDPKEKREVANQVLPLIDDVPDPVERDAYRQRLARILKVDERVLVGSRQPSGRRSTLRRSTARRAEEPQAPAAEARPAGPSQLALDMEKHCLRLLLQKPEMLYELDRRLQKASLGRFSVDDLSDAEASALASLVLSALAQDQLDPPDYINKNLPDSLKDLLSTLVQPDERKPSERALDDMLRTLIQLRLLRIREGVDQLRFLQQDAQQDTDFDLNIYNEMVLHYTQDRSKLERALRTAFQPEAS